MLMFWNCKEVYMGYSLQELRNVRDILEINTIKYNYRVVNLHNTSRARFGAFGENLAYTCMYYVYVHKHDYEKAYAMICNK